MERFVVTTRRGARHPDATADTLARQVDGVRVLGSSNPHRITIEASQDAVDEISRRFGDSVTVEEDVLHEPLG